MRTEEILRRMLMCGVVWVMLYAVSVQGCSQQEPIVVAKKGECVVLLHGLARSPSSMATLENYLSKKGYSVVNCGYPSTRYDVQYLAETYIPRMIRQCGANGNEKIHFVTHSMGGIIVRQYLQDHQLPAGSRVVMISPPNKGSSLVDAFGDWFFFKWINGPAGKTLGTAPASLPNRLAPVDAEIGIITGSRSFNPLYSWIIPGEDDGKVAVQKAKLAEMRDFLVLPHSHTFIMKSDEVCRQVAAFLENGRFDRSRQASGDIK
jgi:pimeloyl-ACP methyl ester carboxylesterase